MEEVKLQTPNRPPMPGRPPIPPPGRPPMPSRPPMPVKQPDDLKENIVENNSKEKINKLWKVLMYICIGLGIALVTLIIVLIVMLNTPPSDLELGKHFLLN